MQRTCHQCSATFEITQDDLAFYQKVSPVIAGKTYAIPPPKLCPECRMQRRLVRRNERKLYHRKCDTTGRQVISIHSPDKPLTVYANDAWWSDMWDPLSYGQDVDFSRPFFWQILELQRRVPRPALFSRENENSDYTNHVYHLKNCYLLSTAVSCEDCYYGDWVIESKDCVDCAHVTKCERCYESLYCTNCYNCVHIKESDNCSDSWFLYDCTGCRNCLFCWNLYNKEYHIQNKPVSKVEFEVAVKTLRNSMTLRTAIHAFHTMQRDTAIHPFCQATQTVSSTGDHLIECKNVLHCFDVHRAQDVAYISDAIDIADSRDCSFTAFHCALNYEDHACDGSRNACYCTSCYDNQNILYSDLCHNSSFLFGCIGLRRKKYCVLNKQYTKEEYEVLTPRIIELMRHTGEWGEYFPVPISPFCYNETVAQDYFSLSREEASKHGWPWFEETAEMQKYLGPPVTTPDDIEQVSDDICGKILACAVSKNPYKIIPQELKFYRTMGLPIPRKCPDQRHRERMALRNPRKLWDRSCAKCSKAIQTTYSPDRPEIVYCEQCYLSTVY